MRARIGKRILSALLAAAVLLSMAACGKKDKDSEEEGKAGEVGETEEAAAPTLIDEYSFGAQTVPGLTSDESTAEVKAEVVATYTYTGLSSPGRAVDGYVSFMTNGTNGFSVVDRDYVISDEPNYGESGSVLMAKRAEAAVSADGQAQQPEDRLLLMDISWDETGCVIVTREAEGVISQPPEPMTMREAQEYLESLSPEKLGLEGESMDEYEVFTFDGVVTVDGRACVRMNVYNMNNVEQSNEFMGCYLMCLDGRHLYQLDTKTQEITELH